jgi:hypothetical protein
MTGHTELTTIQTNMLENSPTATMENPVTNHGCTWVRKGDEWHLQT